MLVLVHRKKLKIKPFASRKKRRSMVIGLRKRLKIETFVSKKKRIVLRERLRLSIMSSTLSLS